MTEYSMSANSEYWKWQHVFSCYLLNLNINDNSCYAIQYLRYPMAHAYVKLAGNNLSIGRCSRTPESIRHYAIQQYVDPNIKLRLTITGSSYINDKLKQFMPNTKKTSKHNVQDSIKKYLYMKKLTWSVLTVALLAVGAATCEQSHLENAASLLNGNLSSGSPYSSFLYTERSVRAISLRHQHDANRHIRTPCFVMTCRQHATRNARCFMKRQYTQTSA